MNLSAACHLHREAISELIALDVLRRCVTQILLHVPLKSSLGILNIDCDATVANV